MTLTIPRNPFTIFGILLVVSLASYRSAPSLGGHADCSTSACEDLGQGRWHQPGWFTTSIGEIVCGRNRAADVIYADGWSDIEPKSLQVGCPRLASGELVHLAGGLNPIGLRRAISVHVSWTRGSESSYPAMYEQLFERPFKRHSGWISHKRDRTAGPGPVLTPSAQNRSSPLVDGPRRGSMTMTFDSRQIGNRRRYR